jgi:hypothetical protein
MFMELTRVMFVTGLVSMRTTSNTKISPKTEELSKKLKRTVQVMRKSMMIRKKKHEQSSNFQK